MPMTMRNPAKRIVAIATGVLDGEVQVVLKLNERDCLVTNNDGMSREQAELLGYGFMNGLRASARLTPAMIEDFINDPMEVVAFEVPIDGSDGDREVFKKGVMGAMELAVDGYWLDEDAVPEGSLH